MKKVAAILLPILLFFTAGCSVNQQFVKAMDASFTVIEPEYRKYVENDAALDADQKKRRYTLLEETRKALNEAKD